VVDEPELIRELLDWEEASLHPGVAGGWFLSARGRAPNPMERVVLEPTPIPINPEEYRGVELVGYYKVPALDVVEPFDISEQVDQFSGTRGITLVGKTKRERFDTKTPAAS
jgi:hypothetical protein